MEKQINIPKLRFLEFVGEWDKKKLNEVATFINGKAYKQEELLESGKYPVLRVGNFFSNNSWYYSDLELDKNKYCDNGDLLYAWSASFGPKIWDGKRTIYHYHIWKVICSKDIQQKYLYYILDEQTLKMKTNSSNGFALLHITKGTIENWQVTIPKITEQTKIANFLTTVDDKLTQLKKKKSLLEQYKKGVMQKLFSQELRFKDENGEEFGEWEEIELGKLFVFNTTNSFSRDNLNYEAGSVKNIHYGDIHTKFQTHFDITKELVPYVNDDMSMVKFTVCNYCKEGDLIVADASEDYADIGKAIEIVNLNNEKVIAGLHTLHARPNLEKIAIGYSGHLMKSESVRLQIKTQAQGTKVLSITTGRLANVTINLPCIVEQTKIANFLSAIDDKINHCSVQIEKMEGWKKGLLQKMFV